MVILRFETRLGKFKFQGTPEEIADILKRLNISFDTVKQKQIKVEKKKIFKDAGTE